MDKWLRNQNIVRIVALLIAVLIWLVVHMEDQKPKPTVVSESNEHMEIDDVSIEAVGLDEDKYGLVSISPEDVRLRVTGRPSVLRTINPRNAKVRVDLSLAGSGKQSLQLMAIGFPNRVEVEIIPSNVTVVVEEKLTKEMPVEVAATGKAAEGFVVGSPIVQPNRVFVKATASQLEQIVSIRGEIDVKDSQDPVKKQVKLEAYNVAGEKVTADISPPVVDVEVPVTLPSKTVPLQIRLIGKPAPGFSISSYEQNPQEVTLYGDQQMLAGLDFYDGVTVDVSNLKADRTVKVAIPLKPTVAKVEPEEVEVKLHVTASSQRSLTNVNLLVAGLSEDHEAEIIDPSGGKLDVTLEGSPDVLARLTPDDIDLIIDVGNLAAGQHVVSVSYSLPAFVRVVEEEPMTVTVLIREKAAEPTGGEPQADEESPAEEEQG